MKIENQWYNKGEFQDCGGQGGGLWMSYTVTEDLCFTLILFFDLILSQTLGK